MSEPQTPADEPAVEYDRRLERAQGEQATAARWYVRLARLRSVIVGLLILVAVLADKEKAVTKVVLLGVPALVVEALIHRKRKAALAWRRAELAAAYYRRRLANLQDSWAGTGDSGARYQEEDHPCAADLDLFGTGSLYERLCTAATAGGKDTLAAWLLEPASTEEVRQRQEAVAELSRRLDLRVGLTLLPADVALGELDVELASWARENSQSGSRMSRKLILLLTALTPVALIGAFLGAGILPLFMALLVQWGLTTALRREIEPLLQVFQRREPGLRALAALLACLETEKFTASRLRRHQDTPARMRYPASSQLRRLARLSAALPLATCLGWRPQLALAVASWRRTFGAELHRRLALLGETEALIALATYAYENPQDPFPDLVEEGALFEAERLGHPLVPRARCVPNDVSLGAGSSLLIVSGSNMSGKSTLLRSVGINAVLALTGAPVRAARLRLSPLRVGATLRVQDSLVAGRSRFYAEVLRVRQLLDLARGPVRLLFLLDELFAGTGSPDRRAGAEAVARQLLDRGAVGLITTHDLAVTELADRLSLRALNVHFEDQIEGTTLAFDYRLRPGVARGSNGLALLRAVGIDV